MLTLLLTAWRRVTGTTPPVVLPPTLPTVAGIYRWRSHAAPAVAWRSDAAALTRTSVCAPAIAWRSTLTRLT